eukprot:TRINITY_DN113196_c0_g1_i1.p1 TRINITY_DN113196_c0_g1~~TRINITY_DN113196_c0_g1_i1.p1  ORF type:complete len:334 (+),score=13.82 TRINITY_DN113196_c0_g1_i1:21-1022(+)
MLAVLFFSALVVWDGLIATTDDTSNVAFESFREKYHKTYPNGREQARRFECFRSNLQRIKSLNQHPSTTEHFGITPLSDLCEDDYQAMLMRGFHPPNGTFCRNITVVPSHELFPKGFDWRSHGAVSSIKNQGQCGSGWGFAPVACAETAWAIAGHTLVDLSTEEVLDCAMDSPKIPNRCYGGYPRDAFQFIIRNGGLDSEGDYPYVGGAGKTQKCNQQKKEKKVATGFEHCVSLPHDEIQIATWLKNHGAVSVGVDASTWLYYTGGIMSKNCAHREVDHVVAAVGFGEESGVKYWILKNTYGTFYGEHGYVRILFGHNCFGISEYPAAILPPR